MSRLTAISLALPVLLVLTSLLAAEDPPPATQPERIVGDPIDYFGIQTNATHVLFIIDRSASMFFNPENEKSKSKVQIMREETTKTIGSLKETTSFAILFFSREPKAWQPQFVKATDVNKQAAKKHVQKEGTGGPTFLWKAIQRGFQYFEAIPPSERGGIRPAIFILTDGKVPEDAQKTIRQGIKPYLAKWKPVLNVVSFEPDSAFLQKLAEENGGKLICPVPPANDKKNR